MLIKNKVERLLGDMKKMLVSCENGMHLRADVDDLITRLNQPLRVAVVGAIKAGKSTLINALLRENLLFTGQLETTYNVCWFKYADTPSISIFFKNGRKEHYSIKELEAWATKNRHLGNNHVDNVKYIEIFYPSDTLKLMELIDTPGLNSFHKLDSENTLRFLGAQRVSEIERATLYEASVADAVICVFSKDIGATDQLLLQQFHGTDIGKSFTPINAIGVSTQQDRTWDQKENWSLLSATKSKIAKKMKDPLIKKLLYTILPVAAKPVEGVDSLDNNDWQVLERLAALSVEERNLIFESVPEFCNEATDRNTIYEKTGLYGAFLAVKCIREEKSRESTRNIVFHESGVAQLQELVAEHFGNRQIIIKIQYIFSHLKKNWAEIDKTDFDEDIKRVGKFILQQVKEIENSEQVFNQLKVLQDYHNSQLELDDDELEDFLHVTGEYGFHCEARLGAQTSLPVLDLLALAKEKNKKWRQKATDDGLSPNKFFATKVITDAYETIIYHLEKLSEI